MLPVLAVGMGLIPFWYVLFTSHSYKKLMNNEIETGLSIITSSYLRSESIITAVEENIHYLNPPVADVFRGFLAETGMISTDVKQALSNMKPKLDNYIFREWVDAAIACQDDKSLKSTLTPIIGKLSDMRIVAAELDYLMYEPFKEFITMAFLLVGNIPLLYFLNKDWYDVLVNTGFGKGILAVCLLVLLISFAAVIRLTKPVVLPTILSRCQIYDFSRISIADMVEHLQYVSSQEGVCAAPRSCRWRRRDGVRYTP